MSASAAAPLTRPAKPKKPQLRVVRSNIPVENRKPPKFTAKDKDLQLHDPLVEGGYLTYPHQARILFTPGSPRISGDASRNLFDYLVAWHWGDRTKDKRTGKPKEPRGWTPAMTDKQWAKIMGLKGDDYRMASDVKFHFMSAGIASARCVGTSWMFSLHPCMDEWDKVPTWEEWRKANLGQAKPVDSADQTDADEDGGEDQEKTVRDTLQTRAPAGKSVKIGETATGQTIKARNQHPDIDASVALKQDPKVIEISFLPNINEIPVPAMPKQLEGMNAKERVIRLCRAIHTKRTGAIPSIVSEEAELLKKADPGEVELAQEFYRAEHEREGKKAPESKPTEIERAGSAERYEIFRVWWDNAGRPISIESNRDCWRRWNSYNEEQQHRILKDLAIRLDLKWTTLEKTPAALWYLESRLWAKEPITERKIAASPPPNRHNVEQRARISRTAEFLRRRGVE